MYINKSPQTTFNEETAQDA